MAYQNADEMVRIMRPWQGMGMMGGARPQQQALGGNMQGNSYGGYGAVYPQQGQNMWGGMMGLMGNQMNSAMGQMASINAGNRNATMANRQMQQQGSGGGYNGSAAGLDPTLAKMMQYQSFYPAQAQITSAGLNAQSALGIADINAGAGNQQSYYSNVMGPYGTTSMTEGGKTDRLGMLLPVLAGLFGGFGGQGGASPAGYTTNYGAGVYPQQPQQAAGPQRETPRDRMMAGMRSAPQMAGQLPQQPSNPFLQWAMQSAPGDQYGQQSARAMGYSGQPAMAGARQHYADKRMRAQQKAKAGPTLTFPTLSMPGATGASILG